MRMVMAIRFAVSLAFYLVSTNAWSPTAGSHQAFLSLERSTWTTNRRVVESTLFGSQDSETMNARDHIESLENKTLPEADEKDLLPASPPLSYRKYLTMQDKRVRVTIRYSNGDGLKPYFLTVAKKIKQSHPDIVVDRKLLPAIDYNTDDSQEAIFEVLVDGKIVVGKGNTPRRQKVARVDMARARSVFVNMQEVDMAVSRARRRRRPSTIVYGYEDPDGESP